MRATANKAMATTMTSKVKHTMITTRHTISKHRRVVRATMTTGKPTLL